jgi:hypothetical protein
MPLEVHRTAASLTCSLSLPLGPLFNPSVGPSAPSRSAPAISLFTSTRSGGFAASGAPSVYPLPGARNGGFLGPPNCYFHYPQRPFAGRVVRPHAQMLLDIPFGLIIRRCSELDSKVILQKQRGSIKL